MRNLRSVGYKRLINTDGDVIGYRVIISDYDHGKARYDLSREVGEKLEYDYIIDEDLVVTLGRNNVYGTEDEHRNGRYASDCSMLACTPDFEITYHNKSPLVIEHLLHGNKFKAGLGTYRGTSMEEWYVPVSEELSELVRREVPNCLECIPVYMGYDTKMDIFVFGFDTKVVALRKGSKVVVPTCAIVSIHRFANMTHEVDSIVCCNFRKGLCNNILQSTYIGESFYDGHFGSVYAKLKRNNKYIIDIVTK